MSGGNPGSPQSTISPQPVLRSLKSVNKVAAAPLEYDGSPPLQTVEVGLSKRQSRGVQRPVIKLAPDAKRMCTHCGTEFTPSDGEACYHHTGTLEVSWVVLTRNVAVGLTGGVLLGLGVGALMAVTMPAALIVAPAAGGGVGTVTGTTCSFVSEKLSVMRYTCCGGLHGEECDEHDHEHGI